MVVKALKVMRSCITAILDTEIMAPMLAKRL